MTTQHLARSRNEHSTRSIQVIFNQECFYSQMFQEFMKNTMCINSVAESYKCKLIHLQGLKVNRYTIVHEIYNMTDKQQTRAKSKLVLTDTNRIKFAEDNLPTELIIRNVHNLADKEYKLVHTCPRDT